MRKTRQSQLRFPVRPVDSQRGQNLVEYAMLLVLVTLACAAAVIFGGQAVAWTWAQVVAILAPAL